MEGSKKRPKKPDSLPKRFQSPAFRKLFRQLVVDEVEAISAVRLNDFVDRTTVRAVIEHLDATLIDANVLAEVVVRARRRLTARLRKHPGSLGHLVGREAVKEIESLFHGREELPPYVEDLIHAVLEHEFVQQLLTEVIYTAIAGFNRKVNPLFGGLATRALEDQIKGFIRLFMPTLQQQAVSFATSETNQRALHEVARTLVSQLLEEKLSTYARVLAAGDERRIRALVRKAMHARELNQLARQLALDVCDEIFEHYGDTRIGDLIDLTPQVHWLADRAEELLRAILSRPAVATFLQNQLT